MAVTIEVTHKEAGTIINGLIVAAERFEVDAVTIASSDLHERAKRELVEQFKQQAADSRNLADRIEEARNNE